MYEWGILGNDKLSLKNVLVTSVLFRKRRFSVSRLLNSDKYNILFLVCLAFIYVCSSLNYPLVGLVVNIYVGPVI